MTESNNEPARAFRAGDIVRHAPTGDTWALLVDEYDGIVAPASEWCDTCLLAKECELVEAATDLVRLSRLLKMANSSHHLKDVARRALIQESRNSRSIGALLTPRERELAKIRIHKLVLGMETIARIPLGARFLSVQIQGGAPCVWYEFNPCAETVPVMFFVVGTGNDFEPGNAQYVGTVQDPSGFVWHYYAERVGHGA